MKLDARGSLRRLLHVGPIYRLDDTPWVVKPTGTWRQLLAEFFHATPAYRVAVPARADVGLDGVLEGTASEVRQTHAIRTNGKLMPVYVVVDESASMTGHQEEVNQGLVSMVETVTDNPMVAETVRVAVLGFSSDVAVRLPLSDLSEVQVLPRLQIRGITDYSAVFDDLLGRIPADVAALRQDGYRVFRPLVFFLTDGMPTSETGHASESDNWRTAHRQLADKAITPAAPTIIAFGFGEARASVLLSIATRQDLAYISVPGADIGSSISGFFTSLTSSIISSSRSAMFVIERPDPNQFRLAATTA